MKRLLTVGLSLAAILLITIASPLWSEEKPPPTGARTDIGSTPWDPDSLSAQERVIYGTDDRIDVY